MNLNNISNAQLEEIIRKATITTDGNYGDNALLNPEQSKQFIDMIQESSEFFTEINF